MDGAPASFPGLLRWLRVRSGISQSRVARASGIDPAYVNRMEAAPSDRALVPRPAILRRLCSALELTPRDVDRLYFAAGRCPPTLSAVGAWDPAVAMVAELLSDRRLGEDDRAELRQVLVVLADRWRRSAVASER